MKRVAISGVTVTGNMGGAAMLEAVVEQLQGDCNEIRFDLLSITPRRDRRMLRDGRGNLCVINAHYFLLVLVYLPMALLFSPFIRMISVRKLLSRIGYFRSLIDADVVVDLSGIAFVDGRGLPLLAYNVACCLPAILVGKPVVKMAQALGPFEQRPNRLLARFVLRRCHEVIARGERTSENLRELGIAHKTCPDVAFAMSVSDQGEMREVDCFSPKEEVKGVVLLSPSEVARRLAHKSGVNFVQEFSALAQALHEAGYQVVFLPHSFGIGNSKNNDVSLAHEVLACLPENAAGFCGSQEDPKRLREIIGKADFFIGCRFHSVVSSLAMGVPTLTIGWSHKYAEMAKPFGADKYVIKIEEFSAERALNHFEDLVCVSNEYRRELREKAERIRHQSLDNFQTVREILNISGVRQ